jgi:hypothetical protein
MTRLITGKDFDIIKDIPNSVSGVDLGSDPTKRVLLEAIEHPDGLGENSYTVESDTILASILYYLNQIQLIWDIDQDLQHRMSEDLFRSVVLVVVVVSS